MPSAKPLTVTTAFGKSLKETVLLAVHPDESHDEEGEPIPSARTFVLELKGDSATIREELPFHLVSSWYSTSGAAYCGAVASGTLHQWHAGKWSELVFSSKNVEVVNYVFGVAGKTPGDDTLFLASPERIFVREAQKWLNKRGPNGAHQIDGLTADQVYIGGEELMVWDGKKLNALEGPDDDNISGLAVSADDRLIGGNSNANISDGDGGWERIDTPVEDFFSFARLGDAVYGLTTEDGVVRLYPGKPKVVSPALEASGLVAVGDGLIAYGDDGVLAFDGKKWSKVKLPSVEKGKKPR